MDYRFLTSPYHAHGPPLTPGPPAGTPLRPMMISPGGPYMASPGLVHPPPLFPLTPPPPPPLFAQGAHAYPAPFFAHHTPQQLAHPAAWPSPGAAGVSPWGGSLPVGWSGYYGSGYGSGYGFVNDAADGSTGGGEDAGGDGEAATVVLPAFTPTVLATAPFEGQKPGTSGLRKKVAVVAEGNYAANFVQAIFDGVGDELEGGTLVVGGDGRYYNDVVVQLIIRMAAANGVDKVVVGTNGILSTPAVSSLIRRLGAAGGIILTASHNPGGPDGDLGIKYNIANGGPAPTEVTDAIYDATLSMTRLKTADDIDELDLAAPVVYAFEGSSFTVEVVDSVADYVALMKEIFDFDAISALVSDPSFNMVFDAMHGVTGPYATALFVDELGAGPDSVINGVPLPDFGGGHPDPNLTYAHELVEKMYSGKYDFGAASDGDGDRNMILGSSFFVNPSDSVAIIAANADSIPYFAAHPLTGLARSMPTSQAVDKVAEAAGLPIFETPTGWKFFGSLMDAGLISICGEESFGQSSVHIREKDGIWAVLAWLSILAAAPDASVADVCKNHWATYGRNYFTRYDYEEVDADGAAELMARLVRKMSGWVAGKLEGGFRLTHADEFSYVDPVTGAAADHQGIRFLFHDGSRIIFRLSGTGSSGATVRVYIEKYEANPAPDADAATVLAPLVSLALAMSRLQEYTGRTEPTVIT